MVLALDDATRARLLRAFPETEFYVPPESVIRTEQARHQRGHFNLIHHETGYKADIYLTGADPLHAWALPLRRRLRWSADLELTVAPPENCRAEKIGIFPRRPLGQAPARHPLYSRDDRPRRNRHGTAAGAPESHRPLARDKNPPNPGRLFRQPQTDLANVVNRGLTYVFCSPRRVPVAREGAAQAAVADLNK